ncbi:MAG: FecR family protein [Bacteroidota bacterium]
MQEERFWSLASLKLSGEASPEELAELNELLGRYPDMVLRLEVYTNIWHQQHPGLSVDRDSAYDKHLQRLSNHLSAPVLQYAAAEPAEEETIPCGTRRRLFLWLGAGTAAAALTGILYLSGVFGDKYRHQEPLADNTVSTRAGSRSKIQLPDGTQVWLNSDSRLTYKQDFPGETREVQLTGEAFFDVAKDSHHPFVIHTKIIDLKVLGTAFNVKSYGDERLTEAALVQGSVEVTVHNNPDKKIILKPNEKIIVHNDQVAIVSGSVTTNANPDEPLMTVGKVHFQKKDSSITEILWTRNQLAFDNASLEEVARQVERWYGVKVTIGREQLKNLRFNAVFGDESLPQVMEALAIAGNFVYKIRNKEVTIR